MVFSALYQASVEHFNDFGILKQGICLHRAERMKYWLWQVPCSFQQLQDVEVGKSCFFFLPDTDISLRARTVQAERLPSCG